MRKITLLFVAMMFLASCATTPPRTGTGFLGEYSKKLEPVPNDKTRMRWFKPGADFVKYNKFMVDYVVLALAEDSEYKGINGDEMKQLGDAASLAVVNAIKERYPIVAEPSPDVLRVRAAIVGLKQSSPVLSGITSVIPVGIGISVINKGTTGAWSGSGGTRAEVLFIDSMTNEVIAAGIDEYTAGYTERFTKWGSVEDAFKYWAERGVKALDNLKAKK
jgi:hypothetical protein